MNCGTNTKKEYYGIGKYAVIFFAVIFSLRAFFASFEKNEQKEIIGESSYKPESTVISGSDVKKEVQEENEDKIKTFIDYCNTKNVKAAYEMLTENCKKNVYPTEEAFNKQFLNIVFSVQREYNLQSWIRTSNYNTYRLRIVDNILATGNYDTSAKYETYITIYSQEEKNKISIGNYVYTEEINKTNKTDILEATVLKKNIYVKEEEYEIKVKNLTTKTILLDDLKDNMSIRIYGTNGNPYEPYYDKLKSIDFKIDPGEVIIFKIKFNKSIGSENKTEKISFKRIIKDYEAYKNLGNDYNEKIEKIDIKW